MNLGTNSTMDVPSTVTNETSNEKEDYCRPRPLSEAYSVPPIARPVTILIPSPQTASTSSTTTNTLVANYSIVPTPTPVINYQLPSTPTSVTSNGLDTSFQGYMKMHATGKYSELLHTHIIHEHYYYYIIIITYNLQILSPRILFTITLASILIFISM